MLLKRIYMLDKQRKMHAFNDPIRNVPILEKPLISWQTDITKKSGLELVIVQDESKIEDPFYLIFDDNEFFTLEFLKKVLKIIKYSDNSLQLCLPSDRFNDRFSLPNCNNKDNKRNCKFIFRLKEDNELKKQTIQQKIYRTSLKLPHQLIKSGELDYDQCDTYISKISSPFHLLFINLYMLVSHRMVKYRKIVPDKLQNKLNDRSPLFFRFLRMINKIGKKCQIHPTAVIEGCIIGDNVIIGAYAVVRLSHIGDGCIIEDHCTVLYSVLGAGTCIAHSNLIVATMCYNEVYLIHGPYQFSIYGKNAAAFATINCDFRLDQNHIKIMTEDGLIDSGQQFLGIALGHRSKIGGGNIIAPGRIVPNDYWVTSPDSAITDFPSEKNAND